MKRDPAYGQDQPREQDAQHEVYGKYAEVTLGIDVVPEEIIRRMRKVFSKHNVQEMREWSNKLMQSY